jgi:hypothetical protein
MDPASAAAPSSGGVTAMLEQRLRTLELERRDMENRVTSLSASVEAAVKRLPRRRAVADDAAVARQLEELEFKRSTSSMSLQDEKKLLREMDQIKTKLKEAKESLALEESVKKMRAERQLLEEQRREKAVLIAEAKLGLRKLHLASSLGISPAAMVTSHIGVPKEKIGQVVGKRRAMLDAVEAECQVVCEEQLDDAAASIVVTGPPEGCAAAMGRFARIISSVEQYVELSEETMGVMKPRRGSPGQAAHISAVTGATLSLRQESGGVMISGLPEEVQAAAAAIQSMSVAKEVIALTEKEVPAIMGTKGSNIRRLEEEYGVVLEVSREGAGADGSPTRSAGDITIVGSPSGVAAAAADVRATLSDNQEMEERVALPGRHLGALLKSNQGDAVRSIQKDIGRVSITVELDEGPNGSVRISGAAVKVKAAVEAVTSLLHDMEDTTEEFLIPSGTVSVVIGKGGAAIKQLREAHPAVSIVVDADDCRVCLSGTDVPARQAARAELEDIVARNQHMAVAIGREACIVLRSKTSAELRERLTALEQDGGLGVSIEIGADPAGSIRMRGRAAALEEASRVLAAFALQNYTEEVTVFAEDVNVLQAGGEESILSVLGRETGCDFYLARERNTVRVRAEQAKVEAAVIALRQALYGGGDGSVEIMIIPPEAFGPMIGKAGKNIAKLQEDFNVKIDASSRRCQVRIRGEPADVARARIHIAEFTSDVPITCAVPLRAPGGDEGLGRRVTAGDLEHIRANFEVSAAPDWEKGAALLRGPLRQCVAARQYVDSLVADQGEARLSLPGGVGAAALLSDIGEIRGAMERQHSVCMRAEDDKESAIVIAGHIQGVICVKDALFKTLSGKFPGLFVSVEAPCGVLSAISSASLLEQAVAAAAPTAISVVPDWHAARLLICGGDKGAVSAASSLIRDRADSWSAANARVRFQDWMAPMIIGKGGSAIREFSESHSVSLRMERDLLACYISPKVNAPAKTAPAEGKDSQELQASPPSPGTSGAGRVAAAAAELSAKVQKLARQRCELSLSPSMLEWLSGRAGGSSLSEVRSATGVAIDLDKNLSLLRARGDETAVAEAKGALERLIAAGPRATAGAAPSMSQPTSSDWNFPAVPPGMRAAVPPGGSTSAKRRSRRSKKGAPGAGDDASSDRSGESSSRSPAPRAPVVQATPPAVQPARVQMVDELQEQNAMPIPASVPPPTAAIPTPVQAEELRPAASIPAPQMPSTARQASAPVASKAEPTAPAVQGNGSSQELLTMLLGGSSSSTSHSPSPPRAEITRHKSPGEAAGGDYFVSQSLGLRVRLG